MSLGPWEVVAIVLLVIVLFGAKKLPDAARSIGRSLRIFKSEVKEMSNDDKEAIAAPSQAPVSETLPTSAATPQPVQPQVAAPQNTDAQQ